jgi:hypothetical protein
LLGQPISQSEQSQSANQNKDRKIMLPDWLNQFLPDWSIHPKPPINISSRKIPNMNQFFLKNYISNQNFL